MSSPDPAAAQFVPSGDDAVGGSAGLYAVGGGLVLAAAGAVLWVRKARAGKVTIH